MDRKHQFDLDKSLIKFADENDDRAFTLRDSFEGVQIFGGIGSGKTSSSGRLLALKYLKAGYGGLVLTAKRDEAMLFQDYCRLAGRSDDVVVISPSGGNYFNFLEYISTNTSEISYADNIHQVLKTVIRSAEEKASGRSDDRFWETALDIFMLSAIDLLLIAYGKVTVPLLYDLAVTAPKKGTAAPTGEGRETRFREAIKIAKEKIKLQINAFRETKSPEYLETLSKDKYDELLENELPDLRRLKIIDQFFSESLFNIGDKTRAIIDFCFSGFLYSLLREPVYSLFCKNPSNVTPDDCLKGKILIVDLPVKLYQKVGQDCQILFKYIWQKAMERRDIKVNDRPVFLWADESQLFIHEHDAEYQATARGSRIATVYITQNMANYYANMGGEMASPKVKSFLGTLATKIFHANADVDTNEYASRLMGKAFHEAQSQSVQISGKFSLSQGTTFQLEDIVRPEALVRLKTGGTKNNSVAEGYMVAQGKKFSNGFHFKKISFNQNANN